MNRQKRIEEETDRTMASLDDMKRVPANPWLFTRIEARLAADKAGRRGAWSPAFQWAAFCMLLIINSLVLFSAKSNTATSEDQLVEAVSAQYGFQQTGIWTSLNPQSADHGK